MIRRRKNSDEVLDEHDQPTEPMYNIVISSFTPTIPGGTISSGDKISASGNTSRRPVQTRQSRVPIFVGVFFVAVQLLLLIRVALKVMTIPDTTSWVAVVYSVSNLFVYPFHLLAHSITVALPIEVYTLLAILVYGLCSRVLVRFLKALLNAH